MYISSAQPGNVLKMWWVDEGGGQQKQLLSDVPDIKNLYVLCLGKERNRLKEQHHHQQQSVPRRRRQPSPGGAAPLPSPPERIVPRRLRPPPMPAPLVIREPDSSVPLAPPAPAKEEKKSLAERVTVSDELPVGRRDGPWENICALPWRQWTEKRMHLFFSRPMRHSADPAKGIVDPEMIGIEKLQRYGPDAKWQFFCVFRHPKSKDEVRQWVVYTDFLGNEDYVQRLKSIDFDIEEAKFLFVQKISEQQCGGADDSAEWSDGVEEGFDDFGLEEQSRLEQQQKTKKRQNQKGRKKQQSQCGGGDYPILTVNQWLDRNAFGDQDRPPVSREEKDAEAEK